jgi:cell division protein FtsL
MVQSQQYMNIEKEVAELEQVQKDLIESNKALVTDISVLSSSERIEKIAVEELGMRKATSDEIVRVSIKGK